MDNDILGFFKKKPDILKRAVIYGSRIVAWSYLPRDVVLAHWKKHSNQPLRLVPTKPLEGCATQEAWNRIWDESKILTSKVRKARPRV